LKVDIGEFIVIFSNLIVISLTRMREHYLLCFYFPGLLLVFYADAVFTVPGCCRISYMFVVCLTNNVNIILDIASDISHDYNVYLYGFTFLLFHLKVRFYVLIFIFLAFYS